MRVASMIICDIIEKLNSFDDVGKPSILVFLPGFNEIFSFMEFIKEWYKNDE
jgi:hypothetical protein